MYLVFYRNKITGVIEEVHEVKEKQLEDVKAAIPGYNQRSHNTALVKEATEHEEYLYLRADCNVKDFKEELKDIGNSVNELINRIGYLTD